MPYGTTFPFISIVEKCDIIFLTLSVALLPTQVVGRVRWLQNGFTRVDIVFPPTSKDYQVTVNSFTRSHNNPNEHFHVCYIDADKICFEFVGTLNRTCNTLRRWFNEGRPPISIYVHFETHDTGSVVPWDCGSYYYQTLWVEHAPEWLSAKCGCFWPLSNIKTFEEKKRKGGS